MLVQADRRARRQREPADFSNGILLAGLVAGVGETPQQLALAACGFFAVPLLEVGCFIYLNAAVYRRFARLIRRRRTMRLSAGAGQQSSSGNG